MLKKLFKKQNADNKNILTAALLIHAAKIDENYTNAEKKIIVKAIEQLSETNSDEAEKLFKLAEKFTKES